MVQREQLWNLSLFNNNGPFETSIKLTLQDAATGQLVMAANTRNLTLNKGLKILSNSDVQPVTYDLVTGMPGNFLPAGSYIVCYQVNSIQGDIEEAVSNECIRMNIDPLSPPLLSFPADKSKLLTAYPSFAWIPPTPVQMFTELNYDIIVSEVLSGQSPGEAIDQNTPIYSGNHLIKTNENYPSGFAKLDTAKLYAWQVVAKNNDRYAAKTEVWTFTINKEPAPVTPSVAKNYRLIDNNLKDTYPVQNKQLYVKYMSTDKEHEASINFTNAKGMNIFSINRKISAGDNYFDISLNNHFEKGKKYTVTITDLDGKSDALQFSIQ